jgi:uncharacterized membrane protein
MFGRYSTGSLIELAVAVLIIAAGVWVYRRRDKSDSYGSQGAVILFVVAAIMLIHALGGLDYRPSNAEAEYFKEHSH